MNTGATTSANAAGVTPRVTRRAIGLEQRDGNDVGRDPRTMTTAELELLGHGKKPLLRAIRQRCTDCMGDQPAEVRWCTATTCPLWAYRMGADPWRKGPSEAQLEHTRTLAARRRARAEKGSSLGRESADFEVAGTEVPLPLGIEDG